MALGLSFLGIGDAKISIPATVVLPYMFSPAEMRADENLCAEEEEDKRRQIHASLDDGSVNHAAVRDFDLEPEWLDQFAAEVEAE
ncbi:hypothetical protein BRARA_B00646 [Brassica rapa]|uniref:Uncharacterized protein n=1 Tax=Brassica campestris TaxID=3711 RepID=A0A398AA34_BRACM|nr:hypothetical protein BRARA_B00646 [Brassica rapa]